MGNKVGFYIKGLKIGEVTPVEIPISKRTMTYYHRKGTKYYFKTLTGILMLNIISDKFKVMKYGDVVTYKIE